MNIKPIDERVAVLFIQDRHYSPVMPRLTKHYLGVYVDEELVGVLTLGWGTQPLQTIRKLFPDLVTKDYYEIGKMCMDDKMPRNSESQMLSKVVSWMKKYTPDKKYLYTWADGIVGKCGYVYQGSNFLYGGFIWTDIYMSKEGEKIHPRSTRKLLEENQEFLDSDKKLFWMTYDFMKHKGIQRIKGKQFRYIYPLSKKSRKELKNSTVEWSLKYPKEKDLEWKEMTGKGKYELLKAKPDFDLSVVDVNKQNVNRIAEKYGTSSLEEFFE